MTEAEMFKEMKSAGVVAAISHTGQNGENFHNLANRHVFHCGGTAAKVDVARLKKAFGQKSIVV